MSSVSDDTSDDDSTYDDYLAELAARRDRIEKQYEITWRSFVRHPLRYSRFAFCKLRLNTKFLYARAADFIAVKTGRRDAEPDECMDWEDDEEQAIEYGFSRGR
jgi:hypothetical protein